MAQPLGKNDILKVVIFLSFIALFKDCKTFNASWSTIFTDKLG